MKKILHIIATPRGKLSRTLRVSGHLIEKITRQYPEVEIDTLNLFEEKLPEMNITRVGGKYMLMSGQDLTGEALESWGQIKAHIDRFKQADAVVVSTPMWNFSIPYPFKHYLDIICQPGFTFHYTANGPEGLVTGRPIYVVSSRGGDYSKGGPAEAFDKLEPYLQQIFGFIGFTDMTFISAQPMDATDESGREEKISAALKEIDGLKI